jgi:hypothetical protein
MATARAAKLSPDRRSEIAAAGGRAASHPQKLTTCQHCQQQLGARAMRKHRPQCPERYMARLQERSAKRRERRER